jgi:hypothetical protein
MNDISGKKIKPVKDNPVSKGSSVQHVGYSNAAYSTQPYRFHSHQILCRIRCRVLLVMHSMNMSKGMTQYLVYQKFAGVEWQVSLLTHSEHRNAVERIIYLHE